MRFIDIHIEQPGNEKQAFDPGCYLKTFLDQVKPNVNSMFFADGTIFVTRASWTEARYLSVLAHYCRQVLHIYSVACQKVISNLYWRVVSSKVGR